MFKLYCKILVNSLLIQVLVCSPRIWSTFIKSENACWMSNHQSQPHTGPLCMGVQAYAVHDSVNID